MQYQDKFESSTTAVPMKVTTEPLVTGSTVFAVKFNEGVMMLTDTLASYGSMAMFKNVQRMHSFANNVIIGFDGEYSDFRHICEELEKMIDESLFLEDNSLITAEATFNFLRAWLYDKRSKMEPLWNTLVVIGIQQNEPFLGVIDKIGAAYKENFTATSFGLYFCLPLLRSLYKENMTEGEARAVLEECARVGYYRSCIASSRVQIAKVTREGCQISDSYMLKTDWPV